LRFIEAISQISLAAEVLSAQAQLRGDPMGILTGLGREDALASYFKRAAQTSKFESPRPVLAAERLIAAKRIVMPTAIFYWLNATNG
jgi:hypothetical protein